MAFQFLGLGVVRIHGILAAVSMALGVERITYRDLPPKLVSVQLWLLSYPRQDQWTQTWEAVVNSEAS